MKFCTGVGVHETNYVIEGFPEIQGRMGEGVTRERMPPK